MSSRTSKTNPRVPEFQCSYPFNICCISVTCHVMYLAPGKLAAVMHVAVILQDCLARHTVIVLAKPCASILSPNMMRMKLDMIMRMKVIVRRRRGVRENG